MKKIVLAASAALLIATPGLSLAQDDHHHEGGGRPSGAAQTPSAPPSHPPATPPVTPRFQGAPQGQFHSGPPSQGPSPNGASQPNGGYHPQGGQFGGWRPQGGFQPNGGHTQGFVQPGPSNRPEFHSQPGFDVRGRPGAQAFGYGGRQYFRYRAAPYRYPGGYNGWANHGWRRGEWLPPVFISQNYFINDWYDFGLWQPNYGYEWIRVGADAVLVNLADGQVVDVVPSVYYY